MTPDAFVKSTVETKEAVAAPMAQLRDFRFHALIRGYRVGSVTTSFPIRGWPRGRDRIASSPNAERIGQRR
jgi:hypothetical protein